MRPKAVRDAPLEHPDVFQICQLVAEWNLNRRQVSWPRTLATSSAITMPDWQEDHHVRVLLEAPALPRTPMSRKHSSSAIDETNQSYAVFSAATTWLGENAARQRALH